MLSSNCPETLSKPRSFAENGLGGAVFALATEGNTPLAATQADMTPLQRLVMLEGFKRQQEEMESAQGGGGQNINGGSQPFGGGAGDATTFVNVGSDEQE